MGWIVLTLFVLSVIHTTECASDSPCTSNWHFYQEGNKCIGAFNREPASWGDAQLQCEKQNARLVTIPDAKTQAFVSSLVSGNSDLYWIGLSDLMKEGRFRWVDDTNLCDYSNWDKNQPDHFIDNGKEVNEDCVHLNTVRSWNDYSCCETSKFVCEKRGPGCSYQNGGCGHDCSESMVEDQWAVTCSQRCNPGYAPINGTCYDIDECSVSKGGCDQICQNTQGSWRCDCYMDFTFKDGKCVGDDDDTVIG